MLAAKLPAILLLPLLVAACAQPYSEVPVPSNFVTSKQLKLQATDHWNIIAKDVAKNIADVYQSDTPIWIEPNHNASPFEQVFRQQLTTALNNHGLKVLIEPTDRFYQLNIDTQVLRFSADRIRANTNRVPTALSTGVWALDHARMNPVTTRRDGNFDDSIAINDFYWAGNEFSQGEIPQQEIIINSRINNQQQYIISDTRSYYISDDDTSLYQTAKVNPVYSLSLTGGK
jgi:hypothetical protein